MKTEFWERYFSLKEGKRNRQRQRQADIETAVKWRVETKRNNWTSGEISTRENHDCRINVKKKNYTGRDT